MSKACGAKTRAGARCKQAGLTNGRCRFHGGLTPIGPASPHFKHGRYSKFLPAGLAAHYATAVQDQDLTAMRDEIALVDARVQSLLEKTQTAPRGRDSIDGLWPQLEGLIEQRRKLVDTESRRLKDLHAMVSVERVFALMAYVTDSLRRHIVDRAVLAAISADLQRVLTTPAAAPSPAPARTAAPA